MNSKLAASAIALALLFGGAAACSDDSGGGDLQSQLVDQIQSEDDSISDEDAQCVAQAMIDTFGEDTMQEAIDSDGENMDAVMEENPDQAIDFIGALGECNPEVLDGLGG